MRERGKIFISGIAGFVGSNLANTLVKLGYNVSGCDSLKFGYAENLKPEVKWLHCPFEDIDPDFLASFDVMVHAATFNIIYAVEQPIDTFKNNALHSIDLVRSFPGKIVYTSTSSVYGNATSFPTKEDHPTSVSNAYDQSKLILEKYLQLRGNYTTLRLSNVYGPNQRPENPYCGVIGKFIDCSIRQIPMRINGDGWATRDFTYIDDVVSAIISAIDQPAKNTEINIGTGKETSIMDLTILIAVVVGTYFSFEKIPARTIDGISRRCLDVSKAKNLLGWEPSTDLKIGIENTIFSLT